MTIITEDYVSLEIAKLLEIKGFKGEFHKHYWGYITEKEFLTESSFNPEYDYPAPTLQTACKWLREEHHLWIDIDLLTGYKWTWSIWFMNDIDLKMGESLQTISTYEEACNAAIKYCLEHLI